MNSRINLVTLRERIRLLCESEGLDAEIEISDSRKRVVYIEVKDMVHVGITKNELDDWSNN